MRILGGVSFDLIKERRYRSFKGKSSPSTKRRRNFRSRNKREVGAREREFDSEIRRRDRKRRTQEYKRAEGNENEGTPFGEFPKEGIEKKKKKREERESEKVRAELCF